MVTFRIRATCFLTFLCLVAAVRPTTTGAQGRPQVGAPSQASRGQWRIDFHSVGPLRIGMSVAQASAALGETIRLSSPDDCHWSHARPTQAPHGVSLTVAHDTIVRIDADSAGVPTVDGIQVGAAIREISQKYDTIAER